MSYDVITVGGGLGGSALALSLAREGLRVLVLERETEFKDRVRGEGLLPWGVNEARDIGVYDLLMNSCGYKIDYWTSHSWRQRPPRDLNATTPRSSHCLAFYHPAMQEAMLGAAEQAGAEVRRGVTVRGVESGQSPVVIVENDRGRETIGARLVVGSDGRASRVREWIGLGADRDPDCLAVCGVLMEGVGGARDSVHVFRKADIGQGVLFFPLGDGRIRTYFIYCKSGVRRGLSGAANVPRLLRACVETGVPEDWLEGAKACGPLAEFDAADSWVKHPYKDGVALIGDAASSNDPSWGNGLSLTLRDARALRDALLADDDWDRAGNTYGTVHDQHFGAINKVTRWLTSLMYQVGPEADARRAKSFPLMEKDRGRSLDYIALGPETPHDEKARRRFFGEE